MRDGGATRQGHPVEDRGRRWSLHDCRGPELVVLAALLRGGGEDDLARNLAGAAVDPREAAEAVAMAFAAAAG